MSLENYNRALEIITENKEIFFSVGERSDELVLKAEDALGIKFSNQYKDFVLKFGAGSFGAEEFYGVIDEDFEDSSTPDAVWMTLSERQESNLPENLLVVYHTGGEEMFCLDYSNLNSDGEPKVVSFVIGVDIEYQTYEVIANDFGDFLLDMINQELDFRKDL